MTYADIVIYDIVGPTLSYVNDVVGNTDIVGPDLRCRMLPSYVMSLHRGADPCRLRAHHADYADFSNPSRPLKIKL
jgi:hypothetical protein